MTWQRLRLVRNMLGISGLLWYPALLVLFRQPMARNLILNWLTSNFSLTREAAALVMANCAVGGAVTLFILWAVAESWLKSWMGQLFNITVEEISEFKVGKVTVDSSAYRSGLREGDLVAKVNGEKLTNTTILSNWWQHKNSVTLSVLRDNQELQVTLQKE